MANIDDLEFTNDDFEVHISEDAENFLAMCESLVDEPHVQYARDFIEDVMETVRNSGIVTEGQWRAVNNIEKGGQRGQHRRRRY